MLEHLFDDFCMPRHLKLPSDQNSIIKHKKRESLPFDKRPDAENYI